MRILTIDITSLGRILFSGKEWSTDRFWRQQFDKVKVLLSIRNEDGFY